jgi:hypothetical protein
MIVCIVDNKKADILEQKYNGYHVAVNLFEKPYEMPLSSSCPVFESFGSGCRMIAYSGSNKEFLIDLREKSTLCIEVDEKSEVLYGVLASLQTPYFKKKHKVEREILEKFQEFLKREIGIGKYEIKKIDDCYFYF